MEKEFKEGELVLFQHSIPSGKLSLVRLIKERTESYNKGKWYIRKLDNGTDTTSEQFLQKIPIGLKVISAPKKEDFHK